MGRFHPSYWRRINCLETGAFIEGAFILIYCLNFKSKLLYKNTYSVFEVLYNFSSNLTFYCRYMTYMTSRGKKI